MNFFTKIKNRAKEIYSKVLAKLYRAISAYYLRKEQKEAQKLARKNARMEEKAAKKAKNKAVAVDEEKNPEGQEFAAEEEKTVASDENSENKEIKDVNLVEEESVRAKMIARIKLASLNFFDVVFEVLFFCAMIFCLIPQIFDHLDIKKINIFGDALYYRSPDAAIEYTDLAICVISILIAFYFFYKTFFALKLAEGKNKAVALLCLSALVFTGISLAGSDFWIFVVLYLFMFFAFELSCSVKIKNAVKKLIYILLLNFIMSGIILYFFDIRFKDSINEFVLLILQALHICK